MNSNAMPVEQGSTIPTRSGLRPAKTDKIIAGTPAARTRSRSRSRTRLTSQSKATSKLKKPTATTSATTQQNVAVPNTSSDRRRSTRLLEKPEDTTPVQKSVTQPKASRRSEVERLLDSSFTPVVARRLRPRGGEDLQEASLDNNTLASARTPLSSNNMPSRAMPSFGSEKVVRFIDIDNGNLPPMLETPKLPFANRDPFTPRDHFAISERLIAIDKSTQPIKLGLFLQKVLSDLEYGIILVFSRTYHFACQLFRWIKQPRNAATVAISLVPAVIVLVLAMVSMDQFCRFAYRIGLCKNVFSWLCVLPKNRGECWVGIETPLGFNFGGRTYLIHV